MVEIFEMRCNVAHTVGDEVDEVAVEIAGAQMPYRAKVYHLHSDMDRYAAKSMDISALCS